MSLDEQISAVERALRRHEAVTDEMSERWSRENMVCCPSCAFGTTYSDAADQCERTGQWLARLLDKRGTAQDLRRAASLRVDYPTRVSK